MDGVARCVSCFRRERRHDHEVVAVEMSGGARQPGVPSDLAAWRTLRRVKSEGLELPVAVCAACGQPMFAVEGALPPLAEWVFKLPDGDIVLRGDGSVVDVDEAEADRRVEDHHRAAVEKKESTSAVVLALGLLFVSLGLGGIISVCDCPSFAIAVAAPAGARLAKRSREAR